MGFGTSKLKNLIIYMLIGILVDVEAQRGSQARQFRRTRRINPSIPNEGLRENNFHEEGKGDGRDFLIQKKPDMLTTVVNDKDSSSLDLGPDILGARRGARFFRHEERGVDGRVKGQYGFVDANGDLHVIIYVTDALGHRIRTETHKIDGYGHELTRILESGPSTAVVQDHINKILSQQSIESSSEPSGTTGKPEITTAGFHRTTRSTNFPNNSEPYFDDEEPESQVTKTAQEEVLSTTLTELAKFAALSSQPEIKQGITQPSKLYPFSKSINAANIQPSTLNNVSKFRRTNSHITNRFPPPLASTVSPPAQSGNSRFFPLKTNLAPEIITDISSGIKFGKDLSSSSVIPALPVFTSRGSSLNHNLPTHQRNTLSHEQQQQIRDVLDQILRGSGTNIGDVDVGSIQEVDSSAVLQTLQSLLSRNDVSQAKNIAVISLPERIIESSDDSHIIHGDVIDGGIINAKEFISEQINRNKNLINGGIIDGGIINDDVGEIPKSFNTGQIVNGGIIDGGFLDDSIVDGGTINGGVIGIEQFTNFQEPTTSAPFGNGDPDTERIMNIMALQKLLESENAETFISLLNIEKVVQSENIDTITKTMILDRMLESDDEETVAKVLQLKRLVGTNVNDQSIIDLLKKKPLEGDAETNSEKIHNETLGSLNNKNQHSMHGKNFTQQSQDGTEKPISKSSRQQENDMDNLMKPERKDKTLISETEMKETENQESKSNGSQIMKLETDSDSSKQIADHGRDLQSEPIKSQDKDTERQASATAEKNEVNPNSHPTVLRGSDAIHIIPSPDLSTGRPEHFNQRLPALLNGADNDFGLINPQANWPFHPFSIASLSRHRSPVFINSTVIVTTTAAPNILGFEDSKPRLIRPDLTGLEKAKFLRPLLSRTHLNDNNTQSKQTETDLKSEPESREDGREGSISGMAKSQEQVIISNNVKKNVSLKVSTPPPITQPTTETNFVQTTNPPTKVKPVPTVAPLKVENPTSQLNPTTPAPVVPIAASPPSAPLYPRPYQLPNDRIPDVPNAHINSLPVHPPILEDLPPIHVTTVLPPTFHHQHRHISQIASPLPFTNTGFTHSQTPIGNLQHFHHRPEVHARHGRNLVLSSPANEQPPLSQKLHQENPTNPSLGQQINGPFIPIRTKTHTISSGPHHVFIQKNVPKQSPSLHSVQSTNENHRTGAFGTVDAVEPVLHNVTSLIPSPQPASRRGRTSSRRLRNSRLKRRQGRRGDNRKLG